MDVLGEIQDALARQLDAVFSPVPIFFETISVVGGAEGEEPQFPGDYIFVDIVPAGMDTLGAQRTDMSVLVDIALHKTGEQNREYRRLAQEIDLLFRPVFRFADRAITVHAASSKIVDKVLHYSFSLRFIPDAEDAEEESAELMGELAADIQII